jgi:hypothetical protein
MLGMYTSYRESLKNEEKERKKVEADIAELQGTDFSDYHPSVLNRFLICSVCVVRKTRQARRLVVRH